MNTGETDVEEPALMYWRPKPTPMFYPSAVMVSPQPPRPITYPINPGYPIIHPHSYIQNQNSQLITDSLIQDEVIRAAKMLFSKRNRTLMHWLNPEISKSQLRIDVNSAWDSLPSPEKMFYISQVLGKFVPHMSSMMINPHLEVKHNSRTNVKKGKNSNPNEKKEQADIENNINGKKGKNVIHTQVKKEQIYSENSTNVKKEKNDCDDVEVKVKQENSDSNGIITIKKENNNDEAYMSTTNNYSYGQKSVKIKLENVTESNQNKNHKDIKSAKKRSLEYDGEDEASRDSGLVIDEKTEQAPKVKRKYTKRKNKKTVDESATTETKKEATSCPMPVDVKNIKVEPNTDPTVPRVKRKYVKHKLVRKKYKKREPKNKPTENIESKSNVSSEESVQKPLEEDLPYEDMDLWIELSDDLVPETFGLLNEEMDSIWETIGDPSSFFEGLQI